MIEKCTVAFFVATVLNVNQYSQISELSIFQFTTSDLVTTVLTVPIIIPTHDLLDNIA